MNRTNIAKVGFAAVLLAIAGFLVIRHFAGNDGISEKTYFYDLSEKKLFAVSREELPPIRGLNNSDEDAVRAVVISYHPNSKDPASRKIAYLEKYAPEFKQNLEQVRAGKAEALPRNARDSFRFVKRVDDAEWHSLNSPEGQKILSEWNVPGPDGNYPVVCTP